MNYQVLGKGKPVVLVPGAFSHDSFATIPQELAKTHKIYVPHLPGFGASDSVESRHDTTLFAKALDIFIQEMKLEKAPIIGGSLGTIVTIKAATMGHIHGILILLGVPGKAAGIIPRIVRLLPLHLLRSIGQTDWGRKKLLVPAMKENLNLGDEGTVHEMLSHTDPKSVVDIDYVKEIEQDLPKAFKQVKNKMYFAYGENDPLNKTTAHLFEEYTSIANAGHGLADDNPKDLLKFIRSII
jgi:pimeloyl-ACP methyl ester carboxylesterase